MPTYEYECLSCRTRFERMQRFSDPPVAECPECGGAVRRVLYPAGIVFKGSGWYITDSRKAASGDGGASGSEPAKGEKAETAAESKPESKAESKMDSRTGSKDGAPSATAEKGAASAPSGAKGD